jgi:hypothetical protein
MAFSTKPTTGPDREPPKRLSRKEFARKFRHAAYLRAKEFRKTDPIQIALKEAQKEFQREAYQEAKKRNKVYREKIKNAASERAGKKKTVRQKSLKAMVVRGSDIKVRGF